MLLTRIVDECAWKLYEQGHHHDLAASCRGYEAAQVGSAACIEVGKDFTLPYYRDLGVVLTIGMTPYEVFRSYVQINPHNDDCQKRASAGPPPRHWDYQKHNVVTDLTPGATQLLHAAGIAFACKLRKASVVTIAYCDDSVMTEPDFLESVHFAALHQLPIVFICEQHCPQSDIDRLSLPSCTQGIALPEGLTHQRIDGADVVTVYTATRTAMELAREGHGPTLLEMCVTRSRPNWHEQQTEANAVSALRPSDPYSEHDDPLVRCQHYLQQQNAWDDEWAAQLSTRISTEIERALEDAMRNTQ